MKVTTDRLVLVPVSVAHVDDLVRLHADPAVAHAFAGTWSVERARGWAEHQQESWRNDGVGRWMAYRRSDEEFIGRGGLAWIEVRGERVLDLGWAVRDAQTGHGYATELGRAGADLAFGALGAEELFAYTESDNTASRAVMRRLGMTELGPYEPDLSGLRMDRPLGPFVRYRLSRAAA